MNKQGQEVYVQSKENDLKLLTAVVVRIIDNLCHERLGRIHVRAVNKWENKCEFDVLDDEEPTDETVCEVCEKGKMKRTRFPKLIDSCANSLVKLIHTAVRCSIIPISKGDSRYYVVFVNDYSRFVIVYVLKNKSEPLKGN